MHHRCRAFTLLELLVVLAIVSILATLALSVYSRTASMRNQVESNARLRRWGAALGLHLADRDGALPRRGQGVQQVTQLDRPEDWFNALPPYVGEQAYGTLVQQGKRPHAGSDSMFIRPGAEDKGAPVFLGYGMNMNLSPWNLPSPMKLAEIDEPARTVFMAESPGPYASTYPSSKDFSCLAPHAGRGNVLFLDGHVAAYDAAYLGVGKGDPEREDVRWLTGLPSDSQAPNYR